MNGLRRYDRLVGLEQAIERTWNAVKPASRRWLSLLKAHQRLLRTALVVYSVPVVNGIVRIA